ncbi:hypothetical protein TNCV_5005711 [Trichonephila clavipes]|nr:hypothetical protein TNCV_5005711 [Trichonephila clavipes]
MCSRRHGGGRVRSNEACRRQIYRPISKKEQTHHSSAGGKSVSCCLRKADLLKTVARRLREGGLYARRPVVCVPLTRQHHESRFSLSSDWATDLAWRVVLLIILKDPGKGPISDMQWHHGGPHHDQWPHVPWRFPEWDYDGPRYIDEVLLPHDRLFRGAVGDKFVFMDDNATCHRTLAVQDCLNSEGIQRLV